MWKVLKWFLIILLVSGIVQAILMAIIGAYIYLFAVEDSVVKDFSEQEINNIGLGGRAVFIVCVLLVAFLFSRGWRKKKVKEKHEKRLNKRIKLFNKTLGIS